VDVVAFLKLAQGICSTVAIVVTLTIGYGVYGAIVSMAMVDGLFAVGYAVAVRRCIHVTTPPQLSQLRPLFQYALPLIPTAVMVWLIDYSDRIFIVHLLGPGALGTYSASYFLGRLVTALSGPLHFTLLPHVIRHHEAGRTATVRAYLSNGNLYFLMIAIPATIGIALLSQPVLALLAAEEFVIGAPLVFLVALGSLFQGLFMINRIGFDLVKQTRFASIALAIGAPSNLMLNAVLIPRFGLDGAAAATTVTFFIIAAYTRFRSRSLVAVDLDWFAIAKMSLAASTMAIVVREMAPAGWPGIIGTAAVGATVYALVLVLLRTVSREELMLLWRRSGQG